MSQNTIAADAKLTPMMEQYRSIKKTLSADTILFFRLGDFYEMFFEDAVKASEILNITLTGREAGEAGRVPMCGIPYHSFQGYVKTLIENNLKVAICEQIGDPKASKGLVERKITRIISPATYLDDENKSNKPEYMASVCRNAEKAAVAMLELSTGDFFVREIPADKILYELSLLDPRELVLPLALSRNDAWMGSVKNHLNVTVTTYDEWVFDAGEGLPLLMKSFGLSSSRPISFSDHDLLVGAAGALLYYLRDHLHTALEHIRLPRVIETREHMVLDRQTRKSLELVSNLRQERGGATLLAVMDHTLTSMGARTLYEWITQPLNQKPAVLSRQGTVSELVHKPHLISDIRTLLQGVRDMERTLSRLNCGVANARDLINLKIFLERVPQIEKLLSGLESDYGCGIKSQIQKFPELVTLISSSIVDEPPLGLRDGGFIRDGYSEDLDELRGISRQGKAWLVDFEKREIERTGIKSLKIKYSQVFGYTIDVSKSNLHLVPAEYIRKQTLANGERYILPELITWDQKISGAQDKIKLMEYDLFLHIRQEVLASLKPLQDMARAIGNLDAVVCLAMVAIQKRWVKPELVDSMELTILGGRHPVVEAMLPTGQFVENDTRMDGGEHQLVVLTGPNMAGKSTYIRQVAQIVLLAQMGSYVPAQAARIGMVDRIFTRIGAADDLARGESTFMVEMLETAHILRSASERSLLILDEVGRGTSTFDGVSIAWAICEYLTQGKIKPRTLFATHYHELTQLEEHFSRIKNLHISVRETQKGIVFLRKVIPGGSDRSYGIHVAKLAGVPEPVIQRANEVLKVLESENVEATTILEGSKPSRSRKKANQQPTLFDDHLVKLEPASPQKHPLLEELVKLDVLQLTPLQALNYLAELKDKLEKQTGV